MNFIKLFVSVAFAATTTASVVFTPIDRGFHGIWQPTLPEYLVSSYIEKPVLTLQEAITEEFGDDAPVMLRVSYCESGMRQFTASGEVLRGKIVPEDTGLFQVNSTIWEKEAQKQGYDINTITGNIRMAHYILQTQSLSAWNSSRACWSVL